jgi:hypothetical protein
MTLVLDGGYTREQLLDCLDREIRLRERVYPRWVSLERMTARKAFEETTMMRAIRAVIAQLPPTPKTQADLFGGRDGR